MQSVTIHVVTFPSSECFLQIVILGAGFDSRAYRLSTVQNSILFEVDHPATQTLKLAKLRQLLPQMPDHVRFVPLDFDSQSLASALTAGGFDPNSPSIFLWEGVTNYLTTGAVDSVLRYVAGIASGSHLIFTYVHRGALDGSGRFADVARLLAGLERLGEPWTFGLYPEQLSGFLSDQGLELEQDLSAKEYRARYYGAPGGLIGGYQFYHVALARNSHKPKRL